MESILFFSCFLGAAVMDLVGYVKGRWSWVWATVVGRGWGCGKGERPHSEANTWLMFHMLLCKLYVVADSFH